MEKNKLKKMIALFIVLLIAVGTLSWILGGVIANEKIKKLQDQLDNLKKSSDDAVLDCSNKYEICKVNCGDRSEENQAMMDSLNNLLNTHNTINKTQAYCWDKNGNPRNCVAGAGSFVIINSFSY